MKCSLGVPATPAIIIKLIAFPLLDYRSSRIQNVRFVFPHGSTGARALLVHAFGKKKKKTILENG